MDRPRLIHYNDAHHFHAKRLEPPASRHLLNWPVDEVLGTGVDLLVLGLGYSDVFFHQSAVGRVVGQGKEVWENYIDWRIMRMVEVAKELDTDQVRAVIERGRETGMKVFPSLKLQDSARPESERFGRLKEQHGAAVCIGDAGRAEWCYDYAQEAVQEYKLALIGEVLEGYRADGLELDFCFDNFYFKQDEIEENAPLMTEFVAKVRALAEEIGARQGRKIPLMARVHLHEEDNLAVGLDVEAWLRAAASIGSSVRTRTYWLIQVFRHRGWPRWPRMRVLPRIIGRRAGSTTSGWGCRALRCTAPSARLSLGRATPECTWATCLGRWLSASTRSCARWPIRRCMPGATSATCCSRVKERWVRRLLRRSAKCRNSSWRVRRSRSTFGWPTMWRAPAAMGRCDQPFDAAIFLFLH